MNWLHDGIETGREIIFCSYFPEDFKAGFKNNWMTFKNSPDGRLYNPFAKKNTLFELNVK